MRIAENTEMLEISEGQGTVYPVLIWDDKNVVLFDTAFPGQLEIIREAVSKAGFKLEDITKLIITHQDMDHIGCAKQLAGLGAEVIAYEEEAPYIQGDKNPVKLSDMEKRMDSLSKEEREFYDRVMENAPRFYTNVGTTVKDGEILDICGGIEVIHTPGHVPGHASYRLINIGIIITGDAANIKDGKLTGANPRHTMDMETAGKSFEKLEKMNPNAFICFHGGLYENNK